MALLQKFKESDSIVIEGDKKIGKITLALYLSKLTSTHITLISPLASSKIVKKVKSSISAFDDFKDIESFLTIFSLREDWVHIKNEYGYKYLLEDLEYFISHQKNDLIVFHNIGALFDYSDRDFIEIFLTELLSYGITYKKKFIFTLSLSNTNYDMMGSFLVEHADLYLKLYTRKSIKRVEVLYSLTPMEQKEYNFTIDDDSLLLEATSNFQPTKKHVSIVVITSDDYLRKLHTYLLDKDNIELTIAQNISEALSAILKNPDYLIFCQENNDLNLSICELAKKHKLKTSIIYLVNKDFLRVDDRMQAKELGCMDMIKLDNNIMHYVLELEKYFNLVFYKRSLTKHNVQYKDKKEFIKFVDNVLEKRGIFSIVKIAGKLQENDILAMRDYDKVFIEKDHSYIFILNSLKSSIENILEKKFNKKFHILNKKDSIDILIEGDICLK